MTPEMATALRYITYRSVLAMAYMMAFDHRMVAIATPKSALGQLSALHHAGLRMPGHE